MPPKFSVIVPCHNQGVYLADALNSLLAQSFSEWECFIINDNSIDETDSIAKNYIKSDSRFKYILTYNEGVAIARNKGIQVAEGTFILPLDADDKIAPSYLEKALNAFIENPSLTLIYGNAELFGETTGLWDLPDYSYYQLLFSNMIYCSAIFRKSDFIRVGGYATDMIYGHEDWDLWLRLLNGKTKVLKLDEIVFYYRKKAISRTTELQKENRLEQTQKQLLIRNKEIYNEYLYQIINDFENSKNQNKELHRQLNLLRNSRINKLISKIKNISKTFHR